MRIQKYVAETIGTFALVFAGTGAIVVNEVSHGAVTHPGIAITFGLVVMSLIYAIGDVSGAHINPAVTIGFWASRRLNASAVLPYIASQLVGAIAASAVLKLLFLDHPTNLGATLPAGSWQQSFVLEVLLTAFLMWVVLNVSTGAKEKGQMAGLAIGSVVALEAMFAGPICGASMNPARSLGPALLSGNIATLWIYLVAPTLGAVLGVVGYWYAREPEASVPRSELGESESNSSGDCLERSGRS